MNKSTEESYVTHNICKVEWLWYRTLDLMCIKELPECLSELDKVLPSTANSKIQLIIKVRLILIYWLLLPFSHVFEHAVANKYNIEMNSCEKVKKIVYTLKIIHDFVSMSDNR